MTEQVSWVVGEGGGGGGGGIAANVYAWGEGWGCVSMRGVQLTAVWDGEERRHSSERGPLEFVLLLKLLFHRVRLHFGLERGPQRLH